MMPNYLFLDTEWADVLGSNLVSLALVNEDGERVFYAERDPLPDDPTEFVKRVVYPLLDRGAVAMTDVAMTTALRAFLASVPEPYILSDHPNDLRLVDLVLAGFNLPDDQLRGCGSTPRPVLTRMLREGLMTVLFEDWFSTHPEAAARRHHALVDAQALRMAWLATTGRIEAHWSASGEQMRKTPTRHD